MIFVTVGSQKFQFNRLLKAVDDLIEQGIIKNKVFAQIGVSDYVPKHYTYTDFTTRSEFNTKLDACDLLITHAGTGVIVNALKKGKKVIAIPRLAKYGEHVDDHQIQLIDQFRDLNLLEPCYKTSDLPTAIQNVRTKSYGRYVSNTSRILKDIEKNMQANTKMLIVSNMYPSKVYPTYGIFVRNFCNELTKLGINYDKAVMKKSNNIIIKTAKYAMFYSKTLFKCVFKKYDIVYIHYASHSSLPVLIAKKIHKGMVVYANLHGSDAVPNSEKQFRFQKYVRKIIAKSSKVIVPSSYFKKLVKDKYNIPNNKIYVYPSGGFDPNIFKRYQPAQKKKFRNEFRLSESKTKIAYVGRLCPNKGWDVFAKSIAALANTQGIEFIILGSGPCERELDDLLSSLKLSSSVKRLPLIKQKELAKFYNSIDCLVFPANGESLGLTAIESLACGTPVIAADTAAPSSYIKEKFNGFKFKPNDYKDLADKINVFLKLSDKDRNVISSNSIKSANPYNVERIRNKLATILDF